MSVPSEAKTRADDQRRASGTRRDRLRRVLFATIALLYLLSVPWYRATGAPLRIVFGLPDWVAVAVACYVAVAVLNAIAWRLTSVPDELEPAEAALREKP